MAEEAPLVKYHRGLVSYWVAGEGWQGRGQLKEARITLVIYSGGEDTLNNIRLNHHLGLRQLEQAVHNRGRLQDAYMHSSCIYFEINDGM